MQSKPIHCMRWNCNTNTFTCHIRFDLINIICVSANHLLTKLIFFKIIKWNISKYTINRSFCMNFSTQHIRTFSHWPFVHSAHSRASILQRLSVKMSFAYFSALRFHLFMNRLDVYKSRSNTKLNPQFMLELFLATLFSVWPSKSDNYS